MSLILLSCERKARFHTSRSPLITLNLLFLSVGWKQLKISPSERAADHCRCSCSYWNNHLPRNSVAEDITKWAAGGTIWQKRQDHNKKNKLGNQLLNTGTKGIHQCKLISQMLRTKISYQAQCSNNKSNVNSNSRGNMIMITQNLRSQEKYLCQHAIY
jgi:hypothetical protein